MADRMYIYYKAVIITISFVRIEREIIILCIIMIL